MRRKLDNSIDVDFDRDFLDDCPGRQLSLNDDFDGDLFNYHLLNYLCLLCEWSVISTFQTDFSLLLHILLKGSANFDGGFK